LQVLALAGEQYKSEIIVAKSTQSLAEARSGARRASARSCKEALELAEQTGDPAMLSSTRLACAETMLANGENQSARELSLRARESFSRLGQLDSEWRGCLIAANASQKLGEPTPAREYAANAKDSLAKLEQKLGHEAYKGYLSRKDIQHSRQQLNQLNP
jgi:hypothetical protein